MIKLKNEKELIQQLYFDVDNCDKEKIVLFGGHFPIVYLPGEAEEAFDKWGKFSVYSLELACKVGKYAKNKGKEIKFVFFVDDHIYEDMAPYDSRSRARRRKRFYKKISGKEARLPERYRKIMAKHSFSEKDVLRHNHGKPGREDCLYFSEKILRASKRKINNACAREYTEFIEDPDYFNKKTSHLITFAPRRCQDNICRFALDKEIRGLSASHIFMESMNPFATKRDFYMSGHGVIYRRDIAE